MPRRPDGDRAMTSAERQAKRRDQFRTMRDALQRIQHVTKATEAREIAAAAPESMPEASKGRLP